MNIRSAIGESNLMLIALFLLCGLLLGSGPAKRPAPDFALRDHIGNLHPFSQYKGNVVLINFWVSWCETCREEISALEWLNRKLASEDFVLIAISNDKSWKDVNTIFRGRRPSFLTLIDPQNVISRRYGTEKFPESYLLNREGIIEKKIVGSITGYADGELLSLLSDIHLLLNKK